MSDKLARRGAVELEHYDPHEGLKAIATAEVAERYFKRAKDIERLREAVTRKLEEQRRFVLWWDGQGEHRGGKVSDRKLWLKDLRVDKLTLHRWRERLVEEARFLETAAEALERARQACEGSTPYSKSEHTGEPEWYTPTEYVEAAREVLGTIDLDPASSKQAQRTIKAARYFTIADNGLTQEWHGRVWLNPPYMQPNIANFVDKLVSEYTSGRTTAAILLTHNYTDNEWFHQAGGACAAVCFTRGRIAFVSPAGVEAAPTQGQAFFYYGPDVARFVARFTEIGLLMVPRG